MWWLAFQLAEILAVGYALGWMLRAFGVSATSRLGWTTFIVEVFFLTALNYWLRRRLLRADEDSSR
jgi:hypothetical protein